MPSLQASAAGVAVQVPQDTGTEHKFGPAILGNAWKQCCSLCPLVVLPTNSHFLIQMKCVMAKLGRHSRTGSRPQVPAVWCLLN